MKTPLPKDWQKRLGCKQITSPDGLEIYFLPTIDGKTVNSLGELGDFIQDAVEAERARIESLIPEKVTGETSDGYHTFNELYEFRKLFNAHLFNEWYSQGKYEVHKSTRHNDGEECFGGGWFIVMATLPTGQISNHYEMKDWGLFDCQVRQRADKWDGHTTQDVTKRLYESIMQEAVKEV